MDKHRECLSIPSETDFETFLNSHGFIYLFSPILKGTPS